VIEQSEFWKIVQATEPEKLRALSDKEILDCQNYFLDVQYDSALPGLERVTASLRLILLRSEIDLRQNDARHRQTQRLARWAIRVGILSTIVILSAVVAILFGIVNRPTPDHAPAAATEATEMPAVIPPIPKALPTATPTPAVSPTFPTTTPTPTTSPTASAVRTRTPATQQKKAQRPRPKRPTPTPSRSRKSSKPKSSS
jgi:hypothetical protein